MTITATTSSPAASGSKPATGRNIYVEGNRLVGRFNVALSSTYVTGGFAWDPATYGFPFKPAEVKLVPHVLVANVALLRYQASYDYVNKAILVFDTTDSDEPNGDDLTNLSFDVVVYSE